MDIQKITFGPRKYLTFRKKINTSEISNKEMYDTGFGKVFDYLQQKGLNPAGPPSVLYFEWNDATKKADIGMAFAVEGLNAVTSSELSLVDIPQSKALLSVHHGSYDGLKAVHDGLMSYISENKLKYENFAIEEYAVMQVAKAEDLVTNVYYLYS